MHATLPEEGSGPQTEIAESDIIFECPQCAKSMAIDRRGAGLMISCPDCGTRVRVPAPDLLDPDLSTAVREAGTSNDPHARNLVQALDHSRDKVQQLMRHLDETRQRRSDLEKKRIQESMRLGRIGDELAIIQAAIDRITGILQDALNEHADDGDSW